MAELIILPKEDKTVLESQQDFTLLFSYTTPTGEGDFSTYDFKTVLRNVPLNIDENTGNLSISYSSAVFLLGKARASCFAMRQNNDFYQILKYPEILNTVSLAILQKNFTPDDEVILSPAIEPTVPQDTRVLYVPNNHSLASYMLQWLSDKLKTFFQTSDHVYPPFVGNEASLVVVQENNEFASLITSFYFCCLLTVSNGQIANKIISELHWLVDEMENLIFMEVHLPEIQDTINDLNLVLI